MKVAVNNFVRRQTQDSGKTYSNSLSFDFFAKHAEQKMKRNDFINGYRDGVRIVNLDQEYVEKVFCPYVKITSDITLIAKQVIRRVGEDPYIQVRALNGTPLTAGYVQLILYQHFFVVIMEF